MKIAGFPDCCGAATISQLHSPEGNYSVYDPSMPGALAGFISGVGKAYPGYVDGRMRSVGIAITVARQKEAIATLKKHKAIAVATFTNRNSGDRNTIWVLPISRTAKLSRVRTTKKESV